MLKVSLGATILAVLTLMAPAMLTTGAFAQTPPSNDDFDDARVISGVHFEDFINTEDATTADDDPECAGNGHTVWYSFSPEQDVRVRANTLGSDYDTTLSAYTGSRGSLDQIECNDDVHDTLQSQIFFDALAGETYYIMVGSFGDSPGGNLQFFVDVSEGLGPFNIEISINPTGTVNPRTGEVTISGTLECSPTGADGQVSGDVRQRAGRVTIEGSFFFTFFCISERPNPWSITLEGDNGRFVAGRADVTANVDACGDAECDVDEASRTVQLRGSGGPPQREPPEEEQEVAAEEPTETETEEEEQSPSAGEEQEVAAEEPTETETEEEEEQSPSAEDNNINDDEGTTTITETNNEPSSPPSDDEGEDGGDNE